MSARMPAYRYEGTELQLFADATVWKRYLRRRLAAHLRGRVLEVGAGLGGSTAALYGAGVTEWVCLEPDAELAEALAARIRRGELPAGCSVEVGTLESYAGAEFDAILFIDVLEHIPDDRRELERAAPRLRPGGHLVVLSPAHAWLYTPFDRAIGHHRRYSRASLRAAAPPGLREVRLDYLDAAGMLASLGNRLLLRSATPTPRQIRFWDRLLVRLSTRIDPLLGYRLGKSVLGVWQRP